MAKIPQQRRGGQTGGGGRHGQAGNRSRSQDRGGRPHAGGGGTGRSPGSGKGSKGMIVIAVALLGVPVGAMLFVVGVIAHGHGLI